MSLPGDTELICKVSTYTPKQVTDFAALRLPLLAVCLLSPELAESLITISLCFVLNGRNSDSSSLGSTFFL